MRKLDNIQIREIQLHLTSELAKISRFKRLSILYRLLCHKHRDELVKRILTKNNLK